MEGPIGTMLLNNNHYIINGIICELIDFDDKVRNNILHFFEIFLEFNIWIFDYLEGVGEIGLFAVGVIDREIRVYLTGLTDAECILGDDLFT